MRLAKSWRTLWPLALSAVLAAGALAQEHPNIQPNSVRDQLNQQPSTPSPAPSAPASSDGTLAPAKHRPPSAGKAPGNAPAAGKGAAKRAEKTKSANAANPAGAKTAEEKAPARRDPFDTLLTKARPSNAPPENLPPGKAGLIVDTLKIDGIVHSPNGMIAIVSNSQQRVYFLRDGDKLYDGTVEKIALDGIAFHEVGKDAFGKPLEHVVTKRLYPSPGEQQ
jgi:hypothetical protein